MQDNKFFGEIENKLKEQYEKYPYYKSLCVQKNISKNDISRIIDNRELFLLPPVYAQLFKKSKNMINELNSLSEADGSFMVSSSTYGDPSYIYASKRDLDIVRNNYKKDFMVSDSLYGLSFGPPLNILYKAGQSKSIYGKSTMLRMTTVAEATAQYYNLVDMMKLDITCLVNKLFDKKNFKPKFKSVSERMITKIFNETELSGKNIVIGGITLLMYPILTKYYKENSFNLGNRAFFITSGGGWSGKKGTIETKELKKNDFINKLGNIFNIDGEMYKKQFIDVYAFCESPGTHQGHWDNNFKDFVYSVHNDSIAYAIDPTTKKLAAQNEVGLFQVLTPYGCEYSANANILQGDLVKVVESNPDGSIKKFTNITRFPGLEIEGCAYETKGLVGNIKNIDH